MSNIEEILKINDIVKKHMEFYDSIDEEGKRQAYNALAIDIATLSFPNALKSNEENNNE